jgi:hypothetical protein
MQQFTAKPPLLVYIAVSLVLYLEIARITVCVLIQLCRGDSFDAAKLLPAVASSELLISLIMFIALLASIAIWHWSVKSMHSFRSKTVAVLAATLFVVTGGAVIENGFWYTARVAAYSCDLLGHYELGEEIYSMCPARIRGKSLASISGYRHDQCKGDLQSGRVTKTVSRIYGMNSDELAARYYNAAAHWDLFFEDHLMEEKFFIKSLNIYRRHGDTLKIAQTLADLSFAQSTNGHLKGSFDSTEEVKRLLPSLKEADQSALYHCLYRTARTLGDKAEAAKLLNLLRETKS